MTATPHSNTHTYLLSHLLLIHRFLSSSADSMRHGGQVAPFLQIARHAGHREYKNSKQETDQTVLTTTKAFTKTTNCTFRAKNVEGHDQKYSNLSHRIVAPTFAQDRCPHFKIRFGATDSVTYKAIICEATCIVLLFDQGE